MSSAIATSLSGLAAALTALFFLSLASLRLKDASIADIF